MVRAICMARMGSRDIDDAAQEVFLRAYRSLPRLTDPSSFTAYLGQITRNFCIDRLRSSPRSNAVSLDEIELDPPDSREETDDDHDEMLGRLRAEVSRLPESQREVLLLFYFQKLSYQQMAVALGITEAAVNQRLSRARQNLRTAFAPSEPEGAQ